MDMFDRMNSITNYVILHGDSDRLRNIKLINQFRYSHGDLGLCYSHSLKKYPYITCETELMFSDSNLTIITIFLAKLCEYYTLDEIISACTTATMTGAPYNFIVNKDNDLVLSLSYYSSGETFKEEELLNLLVDALDFIEDLYLPEMKHVHEINTSNNTTLTFST